MTEWEAYWKRPDVQDIAFKNSENRRSEPSDGVGISRHHLGSRSTATHHTMAILAKKELTLLEHHYAAKCKDGKWVDPKSERIATEVETLMAGHEDLSIEDQNALFLHVNPPSTKGNVYGLGALGVSLASASTSVTNRSKRSSSRDLDTIEEELEKQKAKNARLEEQTEEMQAQLDNQKQEHEAQQRDLDEQRKIMDQLYAMVMNGRPPPTPPS
ncbi:hypothetical protein OROMI_002473 [Orobanche minor]